MSWTVFDILGATEAGEQSEVPLPPDSVTSTCNIVGQVTNVNKPCS